MAVLLNVSVDVLCSETFQGDVYAKDTNCWKGTYLLTVNFIVLWPTCHAESSKL